MQVHFGTTFVALEGFFDLGQKVFASDEKFNRLVQRVQSFAQRVFECPGQCDHRRCLDFHRTIVAVWRPLFCRRLFEMKGAVI